MAKREAMDAEASSTTGQALSEAERRRGQTALVRAALGNAVLYSIVLGAMASLFVLRLGGKPIHVGVRMTFAHLAPLAQLWGLGLVGRLGKARLAVRGRLALLVPLVFLGGLAASGFSGPTAVWLAIGAYGCLSVAGIVGNTGWWPLLQDNTEGEGVGPFFSRIRLKLRIAEVGLAVLAGAFLGKQPATQRFVLPFAVGVVGVSLAAWFMRGVPERRIAPPSETLARRLVIAARVPSVRSYVAFVSVRDLIALLPAAFWVVMLKARGMPDNQVMWLVPTTAVGHMAGLNLWAGMVDRHGSRSVLTLSMVGEAALGLAWFILPAGGVPLLIWGGVFYLLVGFIQGGFLMGRTQAMMDAIPISCQADGFTLATLSAALCGSVGALAGAFAYQRLAEAPMRFLGLDARLLYLGGLQVCAIGVWLAIRRLARHERETPTRRLVGEVWRRVTGEEESEAA